MNIFSVFQDLDPVGYYCLLLPLTYEKKGNDSWETEKGVFIDKESAQRTYWNRVIKIGSMVNAHIPEVKVGDLVRLPAVYSRERFWTPDGQMYILTKCSNLLALLEEK